MGACSLPLGKRKRRIAIPLYFGGLGSLALRAPYYRDFCNREEPRSEQKAWRKVR
jgi:hypothetical protein